MYARVTTFQPRPDLIDKTVTNFREQILPAVKNQKGFKGTLLLVDRKAGRTVGITLWESEADLKASEGRSDEDRVQAAKDLTVSSPGTVEHFEIADLN